MRIVHPLLILLFAAFLAVPHLARAAGAQVSVHAILVIASNERGQTDSRLAPYEANLKSSLGRESFRFVGENTASVAGGGSTTLSLPNGHNLQLSGENGRVKVHSGGTDVVLSPGKTVVLAGRRAGQKGEVYAVIVMAN